MEKSKRARVFSREYKLEAIRRMQEGEEKLRLGR